MNADDVGSLDVAAQAIARARNRLEIRLVRDDPILRAYMNLETDGLTQFYLAAGSDDRLELERARDDINKIFRRFIASATARFGSRDAE